MFLKLINFKGEEQSINFNKITLFEPSKKDVKSMTTLYFDDDGNIDVKIEFSELYATVKGVPRFGY